MSNIEYENSVSKLLRKLDKALGQLITTRSLTEHGSQDHLLLTDAEMHLSRTFDCVERCASPATARLARSMPTTTAADDSEILRAYNSLNGPQRAAVAAFLCYLNGGDVDDSVPEIVKGFDACIGLMAEAFRQIEKHADDMEARAEAMEAVFRARQRLLTQAAERRTMAGDTD